MRYIDDILCLVGFFCLCAAAFGVDWRLGLLVFGLGMILAGVLIGRFLAVHPEMVRQQASHRRTRRNEKRKQQESGGEDR